MENRVDAAAKHLLNARRSGFRLEGLADCYIPGDRQTAYAVQDALIAQSGEDIGGWKVAADGAPDPVCSPLLASAYRSPSEPLQLARTMATIVEAEVAVEIGADLPSRDRPFSEAEVEAAISALRPSLEILGTRFNRSTDVPPLLAVADLQNNSAVISGSAVREWKDLDPSRLRIVLRAAGRTLEARQGASKADVLAALTFLANGRARTYGGLRAGQIIITGARVNMPIAGGGSVVMASFDGLGDMALKLI